MRRILCSVAMLGVLALGLSACAGNDPAPAARSEDGERGQGKGGRGTSKGDGGGPNAQGSEGNGRSEGSGPNEGTSGSGGGNDPDGGVAGELDSPALTPQGEGGPQFARASASVSEPEPDAEKEGPAVPEYAEALSVDMQGLGDELRITITFAGNVPQRMATPNTVMIVGLGISAEKKGDDGMALGAQGTKDGWQAYAGSKGETRRFPGTFFVRDNTIEMNVRWSFLGGPRPFEWFGSSNWFSQIGDVASYSFDQIPNGTGHFPN